jgi:hypothetical protein
LAVISSTRKDVPVSDFLSITRDPDQPDNTVLKLTSPDHTDGVILRSRDPLPEDYRISLRIGHIDFGDDSELNGYDSGDETARALDGHLRHQAQRRLLGRRSSIRRRRRTTTSGATTTASSSSTPGTRLGASGVSPSPGSTA